MHMISKLELYAIDELAHELSGVCFLSTAVVTAVFYVALCIHDRCIIPLCTKGTALLLSCES